MTCGWCGTNESHEDKWHLMWDTPRDLYVICCVHCHARGRPIHDVPHEDAPDYVTGAEVARHYPALMQRPDGSVRQRRPNTTAQFTAAMRDVWTERLVDRPTLLFEPEERPVPDNPFLHTTEAPTFTEATIRRAIEAIENQEFIGHEIRIPIHRGHGVGYDELRVVPDPQ